MEIEKQTGRWLRSHIQSEKKILLLSIGYGSFAGICTIVQAALLAYLLHAFIIENANKYDLLPYFIVLFTLVPVRAFCIWKKESTAFELGKVVREKLRQQIFSKLREKGPAYIQTRETGVWASMLFEQIEEVHAFYANYLPQMVLAGFIPLLILLTVFPLNWASGFIFLCTAPLVPFFMILIGSNASGANKKNFMALSRLSGRFLDRLQGLRTLKHFYGVDAEVNNISQASHEFRKKTMDVLFLAFLSSAALEFLTAVSIALVAVYFGFSYLNILNFGHYGTQVTLFTGLFILILAPEFFAPLRELGTYYHAKAKAIGAGESIYRFLEEDNSEDQHQQLVNNPNITLEDHKNITIVATNLTLHNIRGEEIVQGLNFTIKPGDKVSIIGQSGAGKTTLIQTLLGFLPYQGSLRINSVELKELDMSTWRNSISWVGQSPRLFHATLKENLCLGKEDISNKKLQNIMQQAHIDEFLLRLPQGLETQIGEQNTGISVGQAQRIALGRALLQNGSLWLLDEVTASLDKESQEYIQTTLQDVCANRTRIQVTHQLDMLDAEDLIIKIGA